MALESTIHMPKHGRRAAGTPPSSPKMVAAEKIPAAKPTRSAAQFDAFDALLRGCAKTASSRSQFALVVRATDASGSRTPTTATASSTRAAAPVSAASTPPASPATAKKKTTSRYRCKKMVGRGSYAEVWQADDNITNTEVAVKVILKESHNKAAQYEYFMSKDLNHPNIVRALSCFKTKSNKLMIVQEFVTGGELYDAVEKGRVTTAAARRIFTRLVDGVAYMHSHDVVHQDIKPENVVLTQKNDPKLCDFGMAEFAGQVSQKRRGTVPYMPVEILGVQGGYTIHKSQDVWSLGVLLYVMLMGDFPWLEPSATDAEYRAFVARDLLYTPWRRFSAPVFELFTRMFDPNPATRITIPQIQQFLARSDAARPWVLPNGQHRNFRWLPTVPDVSATTAVSLSADQSLEEAYLAHAANMDAEEHDDDDDDDDGDTDMLKTSCGSGMFRCGGGGGGAAGQAKHSASFDGSSMTSVTTAASSPLSLASP